MVNGELQQFLDIQAKNKSSNQIKSNIAATPVPAAAAPVHVPQAVVTSRPTTAKPATRPSTAKPVHVEESTVVYTPAVDESVQPTEPEVQPEPIVHHTSSRPVSAKPVSRPVTGKHVDAVHHNDIAHEPVNTVEATTESVVHETPQENEVADEPVVESYTDDTSAVEEQPDTKYETAAHIEEPTEVTA